MNLLDFFIRRTVEKTVRKTIDKHMNEAVDRAVRNSPVVQFIKTMQMQMLGVDPKMDPLEAWNVARETLRDFLADEGVKFGDPAYDWSHDGAVAMIHESEIHHWESAP